jgi:anti-sigma B factor antagonist
VLNLRIQRLGDVTVIHCAGRIVFPHAGELRAVIFRQLRTRALVLDLADVVAVDASGLGALVSLRAQAQQSGTTLKLMNVTPKTEKLLRITHLNSAFEVSSAREALDLLCRAIHENELVPLEPEIHDRDNSRAILDTGSRVGA